MVIKKLSAGMQVLDVRKNTQRLWKSDPKWNVWPVFIKNVNEEKGLVFASWNHNPPKWYNEKTWSKWRINDPNKPKTNK